jgi:hypothetical protein
MATPVAACEPKSSLPCVISLALQYTIRPLRRFEERSSVAERYHSVTWAVSV